MFGLWLHKEKAFMKQCFAVAAGAGACLSGKIPPAWFEALTNDAQTAKELSQRQERSASKVEASWLNELKGKNADQS